MRDDALEKFEAQGAAPLPVPIEEGSVENDGARIWYACYGDGPPVLLLHGGLGNSGNWGYQVSALVRAGYCAVLLDSRGHGRSTRDAQPFSYERMAFDILTVTDRLSLGKAAVVGWSDGARIALIFGMKAPARVTDVFFFGCNMNPGGAKEVEFTLVLRRCLGRHAKDYVRLSATPDRFQTFSQAVGLMMQAQPHYAAEDLAKIGVPLAIAQSERDEFIKREHAEYLAHTIPGAELTILPNVSYFAPLQRPEQFNHALMAFPGKILP